MNDDSKMIGGLAIVSKAFRSSLYRICPPENGQSPTGDRSDAKYRVRVLNWSHPEFPVPRQHQYDHLYKNAPQQPSYLQRKGHVTRDRHGRKSYLNRVTVRDFLQG
jgi:hypothetical protein